MTLSPERFSHGVEIDPHGRAAWFRFGLLRLVQHLQGTAREPGNVDAAFRKRFGNRDFMMDVGHFQSCFWRFERAAGNVERCRMAIHAHVERTTSGVRAMPIDEFAEFQNASADLPLYLDMMFVYLRMQADALAQLVPRLCDRPHIIPRHSFREQCKWFTKSRPNTDPHYAEILREKLKWFNTLADEVPVGLRNSIVHGSAVHQLGWTTTSNPFSLNLQPGLWGKAGWIDENLLITLREIVRGWCEYLDAVFEHFAPRLSNVLDPTKVEALSRFIQCSGGELRGFWVYPRRTGS